MNKIRKIHGKQKRLPAVGEKQEGIMYNFQRIMISPSFNREKYVFVTIRSE